LWAYVDENACLILKQAECDCLLQIQLMGFSKVMNDDHGMLLVDVAEIKA